MTQDIKKHAATNNKEAIKTLAKAIVKYEDSFIEVFNHFGLFRIKHNKSNLYAAKANLDSIDMAVKTQLSRMNIVFYVLNHSRVLFKPMFV